MIASQLNEADVIRSIQGTIQIWILLRWHSVQMQLFLGLPTRHAEAYSPLFILYCFNKTQHNVRVPARSTWQSSRSLVMCSQQTMR